MLRILKGLFSFNGISKSNSLTKQALSPVRFFNYAGNEETKWNTILGQRITHHRWGKGKIQGFDFQGNVTKSKVKMEFEHKDELGENRQSTLIDLPLLTFANREIVSLDFSTNLLNILQEDVTQDEERKKMAEEEEKRRKDALKQMQRQGSYFGNSLDDNEQYDFNDFTDGSDTLTGNPFLGTVLNDDEDGDDYEREQSDPYEEEDEDEVYEN
jgi:hypothetical protein